MTDDAIPLRVGHSGDIVTTYALFHKSEDDTSIEVVACSDGGDCIDFCDWIFLSEGGGEEADVAFADGVVLGRAAAVPAFGVLAAVGVDGLTEQELLVGLVVVSVPALGAPR